MKVVEDICLGTGNSHLNFDIFPEIGSDPLKTAEDVFLYGLLSCVGIGHGRSKLKFCQIIGCILQNGRAD